MAAATISRRLRGAVPRVQERAAGGSGAALCEGCLQGYSGESLSEALTLQDDAADSVMADAADSVMASDSGVETPVPKDGWLLPVSRATSIILLVW